MKNEKATKKKPKKVRDVKNVFSLIFSLVAIIISLFSLYLNYFYVEDRAFARIVEIGFDDYVTPGGGEGVVYRENVKVKDIVMKVAFVNTGNRPAIISKTGFLINSDEGTMGSDAKHSKDTFPFLLPPHDLKLVSLHLPVKDVLDFYPFLKLNPLSSGKKEKLDYIFLIGLKYLSIDSHGNIHQVSAEKQFFVDLKEKAWFRIGIKDRDSQNFPLTPLFVAEDRIPGGK